MRLVPSFLKQIFFATDREQGDERALDDAPTTLIEQLERDGADDIVRTKYAAPGRRQRLHPRRTRSCAGRVPRGEEEASARCAKRRGAALWSVIRLTGWTQGDVSREQDNSRSGEVNEQEN